MQLRCSNCDKLLEVPDAAAGKKVRCPACLSMTIAPPTSSEPLTSSESTPTDPPWHHSASGPAQQHDAPQHPEEPFRLVAAFASEGARAKVHCPNCDRALALTPEVAGQIVSCPDCRKRMKMPLDLPPASAASASGPSAYAAARPYAAANPYTAPHSDARAGNPYGPTHQTLIGASSLPPSGHSEPIVYMLPGIVLACVAGLTVLLTSAKLLWVLLNAGNLPAPQIAVTMLFAGVPFIINLVIVTAGIQMARRRWLTFCRTGAILALIPLFGFCYCGNTPFGIWAAVVLFSPNASRDFR